MNDRKRKVLLAAQQLFIEKGFNSTSVQDILDKSKISKGTFYNYFTSKNECLIAILERARDESIVRRRELLIGQDITNKRILAEQITIRMLVNRENNLLPIYEAVFYSADTELRDYIKKHHLGELSWLSQRLIDIYGKEAIPYATDCAVMMTGMIQQIIHFRAASSKEELDTRTLILFIMPRIDAVMLNMMETHDFMLGKDLLNNLSVNEETQHEMKDRLITKLSGFLYFLEDDTKQEGYQYTQFLIDEIRSDEPRIPILESVIRSFREAFHETKHKPEALELIFNLWRYIDILKKK
ncbi:TetR/AcrR family transcriptional regulator [Filibacter tadaridae]|uniref:HTH-type transcriptional repressor NemR n=1 Tax=Filibacter tadaridae TaxID=2483811 RepID=A0A3P5WFG7_9BACL|nr:TetR/AcrR family transcriptional regulator [Filibacter tadaridae]VDC19311.1 HTH-type transcriptional repressor NemR [Filibacter tadaridae]